MGSLIKVTLILAVMLATFVGAYYARQRQLPGVSSALALLGTLMFGANIMLIGQIYHLPPNPPAGTFMWALGALAVAALWPSQLTAGAAYLIAALWSGFVLDKYNLRTPHYEFLLLWLPLTALALHHKWQRLGHLAAFTLLCWLAITLGILFEEWSVRLGGVVLAMLILVAGMTAKAAPQLEEFADNFKHQLWLFLGLWLALITVPEIWQEVARNITPNTSAQICLTIAVLAFGLGLVLLLKKRLKCEGAALALGGLVGLLITLPVIYGAGLAMATVKTTTVLLSILVMAAAIGAIIWGYKNGDRFFITGGLGLFAIKLLSLYFDTFWKLLDRAPFFIAGGLLVMGVAILIERQRRKLTREVK
jgi:uncharacterized membrane protein